MDQRAYELLAQLMTEVRAFALTQTLPVVAKMITIPAKATFVYDLNESIGDDANQYDIRYPSIEVMVKNPNQSSPTKNRYIDAAGVILVSQADKDVYVANTTDMPLDIRVFITVSKKE